MKLFSSPALLLIILFDFVNGKGLWSKFEAFYGDVERLAFLLGNGRLGAMPITASPGVEKIILNIDSLWSGGPFESSDYSGGNPTSSISNNLAGIRKWIFEKGTGDVKPMLGNGDHYGSYRVLGNLTVAIDGISETTNFNRSLDLETGIHTTTYLANDKNTYKHTLFCSYPDEVCVYTLSSTARLPTVKVSFENGLVDNSLLTKTCGNQFTRFAGITQKGPPLGMKYDSIARITGTSHTICDEAGTLVISDPEISILNIVIGAGTNYDQTKGNAEHKFSFKGDDPGPYVERVTSDAAKKTVSALHDAHVDDYRSLSSLFSLDLPDVSNSAGIETSLLLQQYDGIGPGNPEDSLPPNLAGNWIESLSPAWSADYHANINLQMNYWGVDQTGLGDLQASLWNYMQNTWVPRGTQTAKLLYDAPGWVVHDEMNIFGHTAMKGVAQWANYPIAPAWMMQHVVDHFEYSQNVTWFRTQGYPLLKGVAEFWLNQLQPDTHFNDGTLVVNPCNSAEHGPTTFGCTHYQQLIHQVFDNVVSYASVAEERDEEFISKITKSLGALDKGFHIGDWGEVKEWKLPDSFHYDVEKDTHRHLSNLVGWYPGNSISSFLGGYSNSKIQKAVGTSMWNRGNGNGPDGNAGWEKVWRSAAWARLNNTEQAYGELKYAIGTNFAINGLSMYSGKDPVFQIDANFGLIGAMLSMLVVDLQLSSSEARKTHTVVLGPAIPERWGGGHVRGLRLRYGGIVDFSWDNKGVVNNATVRSGTRTKPVILLNKDGVVLDHQ